MYQKKYIESYLMNCVVSDANDYPRHTGLKAIHKLIFNHKMNPTKNEIVKGLADFYFDPNNVIQVWRSLSECERDYIDSYVQYEGLEFLPTTREYAEKYNLDIYYNNWGEEDNVITSDLKGPKFLHLLTINKPSTKTVIFFPSGQKMPPFVYDALKSVVKPFEFEYKEYIESSNDRIISRQNRITDFAAIVRFASKEAIKVKPDTFDLTKAKLAKLSSEVCSEDVCDNGGKFCTPKAAKSITDFKVSLPMFILAINSGLLDVCSDGTVVPGKGALDTLSMPQHLLAKKLFNNYMNENSISEIRYTAYITVYGAEWIIKWHECRKAIVDLLKQCPTTKFIQFSSFSQYAFIKCNSFFRKRVGNSLSVKGFYSYNSYYMEKYVPQWSECEEQIIRLIFSFLSAVGVLDIAYTENVPRILQSNNDLCVGIAGFRITELGAWILGLSKTYNGPDAAGVQNDEGSLVVLPDYTVIISGFKCRIKHETYLSGFLTNVSNDDNASVYKIDLQSAIKAYNVGVMPSQLKKYLAKASSVPLPSNVVRSLDDWQMKVGRIVIQNVTVIETDDQLLLEEIKHIKALNTIIVKDLKKAVIINNDSQKKAKTIIEKNGWFVN